MATEKDPAGDDGGNKTTPPAPRKKSQKRRRKWLIKIPCLEQEFNDIAAAANAARLSRAAYGRLAMLGKPATAPPASRPRMKSSSGKSRAFTGSTGAT